MAGADLREGGASGPGEGPLVSRDRQGVRLEDAVVVRRGDGLAYRGSVERCEGLGVSVRWEGAVHQVLDDGGKESGLEGVLHRARSWGLRHDVMAGVVWAEGTGQVLGT